MKLTNICTGGTFECDDEMGKRLLAEGGYERADAPAPVKKAAPRRSTTTEK